MGLFQIMIQVRTEIFQNQGAGEKKRGIGEFLKFSLGGKVLEMKLQQKTKLQNEFKNVFISYIINYLRNSFFV